MSPGKKAVFIAITLLLSVSVIFASLEILARAKGYKPWNLYEPGRIKIEPAGSLYQTDDELGYKHRPGSFRLTMPSGHSFRITNGPDTLRLTHPLSTETSAKPELWIFGCSFTHGWSLNDEETYPWLLQTKLPNFKVVNFGVGGYNTFQSLYQCRKAFSSGKIPRTVVLAYASFHDERNASLRKWKRMLVTYNGHNEMLRYPYGRFQKSGQLLLSQNTDVRFDIPLGRFSAAIFALEALFEKQEEKTVRADDVSKAAILLFNRLCRAHGVNFIVAGIESDPKTRLMLGFCRSQGIQTADISVDLDRDHLRNLPHDTHPGPLANQRYANKLLEALEGFELT